MGSTAEDLQSLGTISSFVGIAAGLLASISAAAGVGALAGNGGLQS